MVSGFSEYVEGVLVFAGGVTAMLGSAKVMVLLPYSIVVDGCNSTLDLIA